MHRRTFLSSSAIASLTASRLRAYHAPTVIAEPTVFFAHDGESSLVRFTITGLDAPAGRLRVYDARSRLIGTAGVINTGSQLVGELWLRLTGNATLVSALEAPGLRGVHRTTHRLPQGPRWIIHWMTVADQADVDRVIGSAPPIARAVRSAIARAAGVHVNPVGGSAGPAFDPLDAFSVIRAASDLASHGLLPSPVAYRSSGDRLDQAAVMVLTGAGVEYVVRPWHTGATYEWWEGVDGSRVLAIPQAPLGDLASLGFDDTAATAQSRVGAWLRESPIHLAAVHSDGLTHERTTFVIDTDIRRAPQRKRAVDDWNSRFGFPRIVMGPPQDPLAMAQASREMVPSIRTTRAPARAADQSTTFAGVISADERVSRRSAEVLAAILVNGRRGIAAVAAEVRTDFPGHIVFNSGPFSRTDLLDVAGNAQLATDVPPHGFAFLLDLGEEPDSPRPGSNAMVAESARHRIRIDEHDGSIASIVTRASGLEWVGEGMNVVRGARLERLTQDELPNIGVRVTAERRIPSVGRVRSTVTLLDTVPWISVANETMGDRGHMECRFHFANPVVEAIWDRGLGHHQSALPVADFAFARWVWLRGETNGYVWSTARRGWVSADGTFASGGPADGRFRVMADSLPATPADAARFGWRALPFVQHPVRPNPNGRLPRFGSLIELDQPSAAIVAIEPENRFATSATVYVHDLLGAGRMIGMNKGLLDFADAEAVDLRGRRIDREIAPTADGVRFFTPESGITAIRLHGLRLRDV